MWWLLAWLAVAVVVGLLLGEVFRWAEERQKPPPADEG